MLLVRSLLWLLLTPRVTAELAELLPNLEDKWVLLHLVRCVPLVTVTSEHVAAYANFLQRCGHCEMPFLRAWAIDSLHRLSLDHEALVQDARRVLEAAAVDPAPSVRKRLRKILQGR